MRMKIWFATVLLVISTVTVALAQDKKQQAAAMSPDQQKAMEAMMKAMTPGDAHKALSSMAGSWDSKVTMWQAPGAEPAVSAATCDSKMALGNRYLVEQFKGDFMGMPFEGIGYTGYDNVKKEYWSTWIDNMSTGIMKSTGKMTDQGKWTFTGTNADPVSGKDLPFESRLTIADADHHTMEMWGPAPDGKMFKMMEISYTRKK